MKRREEEALKGEEKRRGREERILVEFWRIFLRYLLDGREIR